MMEDRYSPEHPEEHRKTPEERYAYYRRCQMFRRNGEQCKAPAEKGAHICHAHAGQQATERRRAEQRRELLSRPGLGFGDFNSIQRTIAAMAQALIDGRIDCKTAGRLAVELQTWSKLLWMVHRKGREGRKENRISPQISADERRLNKRMYHRGHRETQREKALTTENVLTATDARSTPLSQAQGRSGQATEHEGRKTSPLINTDYTDLKKQPTAVGTDAGLNWAANHLAANQREKARIVLGAEVRGFADGWAWTHPPPECVRASQQTRGWTHGPPEWTRAA